MSTIKVNSIEPANAGSEDYFLARAWVNFNGTGVVAIRADGNVSSITDNGTGRYSVNYSSAATDANYSTVGTGRRADGFKDVNVAVSYLVSPTTSSVEVMSHDCSALNYLDVSGVNVQVTR